MEETGWALDTPCKAHEAVGRVQRQLERLLRQLGVLEGGGQRVNGLKQVNFRFTWANMNLRPH